MNTGPLVFWELYEGADPARKVEVAACVLELVAAAKQVPCGRLAVDKPFQTCFGCGSSLEDCKPGCWVMRLKRAIDDVEECL